MPSFASFLTFFRVGQAMIRIRMGVVVAAVASAAMGLRSCQRFSIL